MDVDSVTAVRESAEPAPGMLSLRSAHGVKVVDFVGLPLAAGSFDAVADWLAGAIGGGDPERPLVVSHINVANYHHLHGHQDLRKAMSGRSAMLFDGIGMKVGAMILGYGHLDDLNGTDLLPLVMDRLEGRGVRVFCVGSREEVAAHAARRIEQRWPDARVVGWNDGYFDVADEEGICERIRDSGADLLLVGRGFGLQEEFAIRNAARLNVGVIWTVGALFEFVSATTPRAPAWMRGLRLEWLFRLLREPRRMFWRNFISAPWVLLHAIRNRRSGSL